MKLSVTVLAYNHARYLRQALDSVLMQRTSFPFRIVVLDDYSRDGTPDIIAGYQRQHPDRITSILHRDNAGALRSAMELLDHADGEYIAMLEGDDFWLDPHKLQTQVDFLDAHGDFVLCGHDCVIRNEWTGTEVTLGHGTTDFTLSLEQLIDFHIPTASMVFRNGLVRAWPDSLIESGFGDRPLAIMLAQMGKVRHFARPMSVYRVHPAGAWCGRYVVDPFANQLDTTPEGWQLLIRFWEALAVYLNHEYDDRIAQLIANARAEASRDRPQTIAAATAGDRETPAEAVPVLRPQLPVAERLLPYLRRIDRSRVYTNFGPLNSEFQERLTRQLGMSGPGVVTANSGTSALVAAILAVAGRARPEKPLALLPAFTFVATATAIEMCGYAPHLADIASDTWMLEPNAVLASPMLDRVGVVVPVSPFGRPVAQAGWADFQERTGIPVVIDGAASFEGLMAAPKDFVGAAPVALSFHATKSFGVGEGGCVVMGRAGLVESVTQALNFGFYGARESRSPHINGKLNEYQAAVGLAELDGWPEKHARLSAVAEEYRRCFSWTQIAHWLIAAPEISSSYVLLRCATAHHAEQVQWALSEDRIGFRKWYGHGLHSHAYYAHASREDLSVTDDLVPRVLGLPLAVDLSSDTIPRVVAAVVRAVST